MSKKVIVWLRRDLRLEDHTALNKAVAYAIEHRLELIPLFIFDSEILSELEVDDKRISFIHHQLELINVQLSSYKASVLCLHDSVLSAFKKLFKTYKIAAIFTNEDYEPYAIKRDTQLREFTQSKNVRLYSFKDQVIFHKDEVLNSSQKPYLVFTPFKNAWLNKLETINLTTQNLNSNAPFYKYKYDLISIKQLGFKKVELTIPTKEVSASLMSNYDKTRDIPSLDNGTSHLGVHLRFGTISIRSLVLQCLEDSTHQTYLSELIWREFFMCILYHFPNSVLNSFNPNYDRIIWRNNPEEFKLWTEGKTGYPLVDAGMRELNSTGYMHNRVRMLVASFLCKHLLIDWRWGEAYFASQLLDYELSSNVGNWQWACGSGVDAAPYFRIFNPETQLKKFDSKLEYINKWVPEFQSLNYPLPIVDHIKARERCLSTYKEALQ